jgi:hypothetical protein
MLGGDHTITLAALRATINHWGVVNVIHFDSHIDTWNPTQLGGSFFTFLGDFSILTDSDRRRNNRLRVRYRQYILHKESPG